MYICIYIYTYSLHMYPCMKAVLNLFWSVVIFSVCIRFTNAMKHVYSRIQALVVLYTYMQYGRACVCVCVSLSLSVSLSVLHIGIHDAVSNYTHTEIRCSKTYTCSFTFTCGFVNKHVYKFIGR